MAACAPVSSTAHARRRTTADAPGRRLTRFGVTSTEMPPSVGNLAVRYTVRPSRGHAAHVSLLPRLPAVAAAPAERDGAEGRRQLDGRRAAPDRRCRRLRPPAMLAGPAPPYRRGPRGDRPRRGPASLRRAVPRRRHHRRSRTRAVDADEPRAPARVRPGPAVPTATPGRRYVRLELTAECEPPGREGGGPNGCAGRLLTTRQHRQPCRPPACRHATNIRRRAPEAPTEPARERFDAPSRMPTGSCGAAEQHGVRPRTARQPDHLPRRCLRRDEDCTARDPARALLVEERACRRAGDRDEPQRRLLRRHIDVSSGSGR